jgi:hypothetical protein
MRFKTSFTSTLLIFICLLSIAQNKHNDDGYLIYTLGRDTTMIGHYNLKGNDFNMTIVVMSHLNVHKVSGRLFPNGDIRSVEGYAYRPTVSKDSQLIQSYKLVTRNDSTFIELKTGNSINKYSYPGRGMMHLGINPYYFYYPLIANYAPKKSGDSISSHIFAFDKGFPFIIKRINKTTLTASSATRGVYTLYLNKNGKVVSIDAIGTSSNLRGTVVPNLNMDSVINAYRMRDQQYGAVADLNKTDSIQSTIGSTVIKINYSRPSMRGRVIFGRVVPWNHFWRTGANAATKITLSGPIFFNNKELPAGEYSIFTMPTEHDWTIMFNKEANIWGLLYNPSNDVLRIPMQVVQLKEPVQLMTIEIAPIEKGGVINIMWENTKVFVEFTTQK